MAGSNALKFPDAQAGFAPALLTTSLLMDSSSAYRTPETPGRIQLPAAPGRDS